MQIRTAVAAELTAVIRAVRQVATTQHLQLFSNKLHTIQSVLSYKSWLIWPLAMLYVPDEFSFS